MGDAVVGAEVGDALPELMTDTPAVGLCVGVKVGGIVRGGGGVCWIEPETGLDVEIRGGPPP